ncbi:hypothetical protein RF11_03532 [Thelohanellus kitauei]|uniref:Uncharacterized protein n=1 Tax=Thelohanellus kitauei TaxID=669202 RepID=A0A0C2MHZ2_THEKT|nr:hypothetical protein RF11_03532 [Thelohanellus kitauei]
MDFDKIYKEFALNVQLLSSPNRKKKTMGVRWMNKFEKSVNKITHSLLTTFITECDVFTVSIHDMFNDLLSVVPSKQGPREDKPDELFSIETAMALMDDLFSQYRKLADRKLDIVKTKRKAEVEVACREIIVTYN